MFRDGVIIIEILKHNYILGQVLHRTNMFGTSYSNTGRHYITINGKIIAQAISQTINSPILKTIGKIMLSPMSISVVALKTTTLQNTNNNFYKLNFNTFQLTEHVILLDIVHKVDHKTPHSLNIPILNTNNSSYSISKSSPIATQTLARKCKEVQEVSCSKLQCDTTVTSYSTHPRGSQGKATGSTWKEVCPHDVTECVRHRQDQPDRAGYPHKRSSDCTEGLHHTTEVPCVCRL